MTPLCCHLHRCRRCGENPTGDNFCEVSTGHSWLALGSAIPKKAGWESDAGKNPQQKPHSPLCPGQRAGLELQGRKGAVFVEGKVL